MRLPWLNVASSAVIAAAIALTSSSCSKTPTTPSQGVNASEAIVSIPPCLTTVRIGKAEVDSLDGSKIYNLECAYIKVASDEATLVRGLLNVLQNFTGNFSGTWTSNSDGRVKHIAITESGSSYGGETFAARLDLTDGTNNAFQMFYDTGSSVRGVIVMAPTWLDRNTLASATDSTRVRLHYNGADATYGKTIVVEVSGLPTVTTNAPGSLMMRAWMIGSTFRMQGNSDHPNAELFNDLRTLGPWDYAFLAHATVHADSNADSACMKVGIVPSSTTTTDSLVDSHSVDRVLTGYLNTFWPTLPPDSVTAFVSQAQNPGWYSKLPGSPPGYLGNGPALPAGFAPLNEWGGMSVYAPSAVHALHIDFAGAAF